MNIKIDVKKYTIDAKPVQITKKRSKLKIVLHTTLGDINGEVNFSDFGEYNLDENRNNYTVYCASSPDMNLQELITSAKLISWRKKEARVIITQND